MAKFKALSRGTQLVLVAGPLLFLSLFFTWQHVAVDYGRAGVREVPLDGWDAWGPLLALLVARPWCSSPQEPDGRGDGRRLSRATVTLGLGSPSPPSPWSRT